MESSPSTPRSARTKKKSALSRLAARRRLTVQDGDMGSKTSLQSSPSTDRSADGNSLPNSARRSQYPIDADVQIQNSRSLSDQMDSDEGIEVGTTTMKSSSDSGRRMTSQDFTSSSRLRHQQNNLNNDSDDDDDDDEDDDISNSAQSYRLSPRYSDTNKFNGEVTIRKSRDDSRHVEHENRLSMEESTRLHPDYMSSPTRRHRQSSLAVEQSDDDDDDDETVLRSRNSFNRRTNTVGFVSGTRDYDEEANEMDDSVSDLRQYNGPLRSGSPIPSALSRQSTSSSIQSSVTSNLYASFNRPISGRSGDLMSQNTYASSSVLPAVSTQEARSRSYMFGSISKGSMLGSDELERYFPDRKLRLFVASWNMCEMKQPPNSLDDLLLPETSEYVHDMYVIATQESPSNRREWEIRLQETLGPQHVLFHSAAHGVLYLMVFLRRDLTWYCSVAEDDRVSTRPGLTNIKTKGAVAISFTFFGTSFLFINSHLSPHDGKMKERVADYNKICSGLHLPKSSNNQYSHNTGDVTKGSDCVFWLGDLNFRIEKERERVTDKVKGIETGESDNYEDLIQHDELFRARNEGLAFQDFQEGRIKFKPTYKYDIGTDQYDTSPKLRIPSYTDRVLFRNKKKGTITCFHYASAQNVCDSDHKPVYAMYEVSIRPGRDKMPLAAGNFNRDVWLEANKRRATQLGSDRAKQQSSKVCVIQ